MKTKTFAILAVLTAFFVLSCELPVDPPNIIVAFTDLTADGSANLTTSKLILTFDKDIDGLTAADITLTVGTTGAVKDILTRIDTRTNTGYYELALKSITASGMVTVSVSKSGYTITGGSRQVMVYYNGSNNNNNGNGNNNIPSELIAKWYTSQALADAGTGTATVEFTSEGKLLYMGIDNQLTITVENNVISNYRSGNKVGTVKYNISGTAINFSDSTGEQILSTSLTFYKKGGSQGNNNIEVAFTGLTANGSATTATTTRLTLTFAQDITGLTAADITFNAGSTGAGKGVLSRTGTGIYELTVSGITAGGSITVSISKSGYTITGGSKQVMVYYYNSGNNNNGDGIPIELVAKWYTTQASANAGTGTATIEFTPEGKLLYMGIDNNLTITVEGNVISNYRSGNKVGTVKYNLSGTAISFYDSTGEQILSTSLTFYKKASTNQTPVASDFEITGTGSYTYDGYGKSVTISPKSGKSNGTITIYYNSSTTPPTAVGTYTVTFNVAAVSGWNAASGLSAGTVTISPKPVTITAPSGSPTKVYDGTTAYTENGIIIGSLNDVVSGDTVSASIASATYNDADVANANQITIVYAISGADAANYLPPANDTIVATITKADGVQVSAPTAASKTYNRITVNLVTASTGQSVEYAISTVSDGTGLSAWQSGTVFTGLNANTTYYVYARSVVNDNYSEGVASVSDAITTSQSGTAEVVAYYWVNERDVLAITDNTGNGAITLSPGDELTITAQGAGYTNQQWHLNGVNTGKTGNVYTFSSTIAGNYTVGLFVEKNGKYYNANFAITVEE